MVFKFAYNTKLNAVSIAFSNCYERWQKKEERNKKLKNISSSLSSTRYKKQISTLVKKLLESPIIFLLKLAKKNYGNLEKTIGNSPNKTERN